MLIRLWRIVKCVCAICWLSSRLILVEALQDRERERTRSAKTALVDWQGLLRANVQQARQAIGKLLAGRLVVTPSEESTVFTISGTGLIEPLLDQTLRVPEAVVTPAGFEQRRAWSFDLAGEAVA